MVRFRFFSVFLRKRAFQNTDTYSLLGAFREFPVTLSRSVDMA